MQTLEDFTDEEIKQYIAHTHDRILNLASNKNEMLNTLKARENSFAADKVALALYPELLRDGYNKSQLKDIKRRMLMDAKSGAIKCKNKRLFALPDWYAACEYWFLHVERPCGLLNNGEIACRPYLSHEKADVLRSPHLYMEHALRKIVHNPEIYKWLCSDGIYTSCHDLITRILQFDCDGDQLNVVVDQTILTVAERNIKEFDVIPLFYDANKAKPEMISQAAMFHGLKRAHEFSNIGEISNMLTRLWNRDNPDRLAAAFLCYKNNLIIDAAKTGYINDYTNYPDVEKRINKATGGPNGRMPFFFQFSRNGRKEIANGKKKKVWAKINNSTMNRICQAFDDIGNINMNFAGVSPFNWQMLMSAPCFDKRPEIVSTFCEIDNSKLSLSIVESEESPTERELMKNNGILEEDIIYTLTEKYGSLEVCYPYITKYLFSGEGVGKATHKQTFWRVFGDIALKNLRENLKNHYICDKCGMKIPNWVDLDQHFCPKDTQGFYQCIDCGKLCERMNSRQCRCMECQVQHRNENKRNSRLMKKQIQKESGEKRTSFLPLA